MPTAFRFWLIHIKVQLHWNKVVRDNPIPSHDNHPPPTFLLEPAAQDFFLAAGPDAEWPDTLSRWRRQLYPHSPPRDGGRQHLQELPQFEANWKASTTKPQNRDTNQRLDQKHSSSPMPWRTRLTRSKKIRNKEQFWVFQRCYTLTCFLKI